MLVPPPQGRPPQFSREDQDRMQAEMAADEARKVEAHFRAIGKIKRHGVYDTGCPKCGQATIGKVHCPGRDREQTEGLECYILGGHLHAQCGTCKFVWVEHTKDDELDRDWRGGLRFDEMLVNGILTQIPIASAAEQWGVGADADSDVPLYAGPTDEELAGSRIPEASSEEE